MAGHAFAQGSVVVLPDGALFDAEWPVLGVLALGALVSSGPGAGAVALLVTLHALAVAGAVEPEGGVAARHALEAHLESLAGQTELVPGSPAPLGRALLVADVTLL
jgi:hypothetical protein